MWRVFREFDLAKVDRVCAITPKQAMDKYHEVGNSPMHADLEQLPIAEHLPELVPKLTPEEIASLDEEIKQDEFEQVARALRRGGKARDVFGLQAGIFKFLDDSSATLLTQVLNKELKNRKLSELRADLHLCKDVPLYKKGDPKDPDNYRYLVISPLLLKFCTKLYSDRLYSLLESKGYFCPTQYGFRSARGTLESIMVFNRIREDLGHYSHHRSSKVLSTLVDLRKAFPSLNWRLVTGVMTCLGIEESTCWQIINSSHRHAVHQFHDQETGIPGDSFTLTHGTKEGCVSSPLVFLISYTAVLRYYRKLLQGNGAEELKGVRLYSRESTWHMPRVDKLHEIFAGSPPEDEDETTEIDHIRDLLFADDTTLLEHMTTEELTEFVRLNAALVAEDLAPEESDAMKLLTKALHAAGCSENETKRYSNDITKIAVRNLGAWTDPVEDVRQKRRKAWTAYNKLRGKMSGVSNLHNERRGSLIVIMIRSIFLYGLAARYVGPEEIRALEREELIMMQRIQDLPWWERILQKKSASELRRTLKVPPLAAHLKYLQMRFLGHVLRSDSDDITRRALVGQFLPILHNRTGP
ncbi:unnamed protein product, partial [Amoebophrya sp. A120]|eukprot:GSA120T00022345001.1